MLLRWVMQARFLLVQLPVGSSLPRELPDTRGYPNLSDIQLTTAVIYLFRICLTFSETKYHGDSLLKAYNVMPSALPY